MLPGYSMSFRDGAGGAMEELYPADLPSGKAHSCLASFVIYPRNF